MSQVFSEPYERPGENSNVELDISDYAMNLKGKTSIDKVTLASKKYDYLENYIK